MITIIVFFPKLGQFFAIFEKKEGEISPTLVMSLLLYQLYQIFSYSLASFAKGITLIYQSAPPLNKQKRIC